jgi:flagellar biosynthesis protein FliR
VSTNALTFQFDPVLLMAFALALVRATAWLFFSPPFNTRMIPSVVKAGIAATLALCAAPHIAAAWDDERTRACYIGA